MQRIVCVHGIRQQRKAADVLAQEWGSWLRGGIRLACGNILDADEVLRNVETRWAFYGDFFRPPARHLGTGDAWLTPADLTDFDRELLHAWWRASAEVDPGVISPDAPSLSMWGVQAALRALSRSRYFSGVQERVLLGDLAQVRRYLLEPELRRAIRQRLVDVVDESTTVIVAHSLGSVVAYETLCEHPGWNVRALVTLGSPLGIRNLIFDRLEPAPSGRNDPLGQWPGRVAKWTNVADEKDIVALVKDFRPLFGPRIENYLVSNGVKAHSVQPYLSAVETGAAVLAGLTESAASS
jgi:hypothetical protein